MSSYRALLLRHSAILAGARGALREAGGAPIRAAALRNVVIQLRKLVNHPQLVEQFFEGTPFSGDSRRGLLNSCLRSKFGAAR